jgi:uncharacterized protein (TIGR02246 family)
MSLATGDEVAIRRVLDDYLELWNRGDAKACADLYDKTGDCLAVDGTFLRSHAQIRQYYDDNLSAKYAGFQAHSVEVLGVRELGSHIQTTGKSMNVFRKQTDNSWKYAQSIFNFDQPLE